MMPSFLTRTVWVLSLVSLFADIASEMLYPFMPVFLSGVGFSVVWLGILEGASRLITGFGKGYFGSLSDNTGKRHFFIRAGYLLSGLSKPMMGLFPFFIPVFLARLSDRLGKGMRGSARDAVLVGESAKENRGKVFGFHRAMDTAGAAAGPALTLLLIYFTKMEIHQIILIAFFPGIISWLFTFLLPGEKTDTVTTPKKRKAISELFGFWKNADPGYKRLVVGMSLFSFLLGSDFFRLLRAEEWGFSLDEVVWAYIGFNTVYAIASYPLGHIGDRIGFKKVFIFSVILFAISSFLLFCANEKWMVFMSFGAYGIFAAAQEGVGKSWVTLYMDKENAGAGIGLYELLMNVSIVLASPLTGILWNATSGETTYLISAIAAFVLIPVFIFLFPRNPAGEHS